jgi:hypothetical protein
MMSMKRLLLLAALCMVLSGCRFFRSTKVALPKGSTVSTTSPGSASSTGDVQKTVTQVKSKAAYQGRSVEEWGDALLKNPDQDTAVRASRALHIMGGEGRPYLIAALDSPFAENRRAALDALTVSDMRSYGEDGRQMLVKLAGDPGDMRIRQRATLYLVQWNRATPAP